MIKSAQKGLILALIVSVLLPNFLFVNPVQAQEVVVDESILGKVKKPFDSAQDLPAEEVPVDYEIIDDEQDVDLPEIVEEPQGEPEVVVEEPVIAPKKIEKTPKFSNLNYRSVMEEMNNVRGNSGDGNAKKQISEKLEQFIEEEEARLKELGVSDRKMGKYLDFLQGNKDFADNKKDGFLDNVGKFLGKIGDGVKSIFVDEDSNLIIDKNGEEIRIDFVNKPSSFEFNNERILINNISEPVIDYVPEKGLTDKLMDTVKIRQVDASYSYEQLPVLADLEQDELDVVFSSDIEALADELNYNPVNIYNYVRDNIEYEAYYGVKKGAQGCLVERVCNDYDANSLFISLLRASNIPARYHKGVAVLGVEQLQNMLGVDSTRSVYANLFLNKVPVFTISGNDIGEDFETADFSNETHLGVEWVFTEVFYDYDYRGGNIDNFSIVEDFETDLELQDYLLGSTAKQWIPLDVMVKDYEIVQNEILADTASFDSMNFWTNYLQTYNALAPIDKFLADMGTQTGKDPMENLSGKSIGSNEVDILPYRLPYLFGEGEDEHGNVISKENWSVLPEALHHKVELTLMDKDSSTTVLAKEFNALEMNNVAIEIVYEGATQTDKDIIDSYGGIAYTPSALVDIVPVLITDTGYYEVGGTIEIGDSLILGFEVTVGSLDIDSNEKFSTAGNDEGIFMTFSQIQEDIVLDDETDEKRESKVLLSGNSAIARAYLDKIIKNGNTLADSLDYSYNYSFARAVVTQNRVLNEVDGIPTTFEFSGLSIDATSYINDWSNRGDYDNHRQDFRLLWGLDSSYYEGQIFDDLAGLEGIATVQGLQYASNESGYTVYTIDSSNESVIDTLNLSDNTKANMHSDVAEGNTIVTPDKYVEKGTWRGILYISLDPKWTGTYAIGEQVANGGWTIEDLERYVYESVEEQQREYYKKDIGDSVIIFEDGKEKSLKCRISETDLLFITLDPGYSEAFGPPCAMEIGLVNGYEESNRSYMLTTKAVMFSVVNGNEPVFPYWISHEEIRQILERDKLSDPFLVPQSTIKLFDNGFHFDVNAGTFAQKGGYNFAQRTKMEVFYEPTDQRGNGNVVWGKMYEKIRDNRWIQYYLGYPTSNKQETGKSISGTDGKYQNFINGQLYLDDGWFKDKVFYVYGAIAQEFNSQEYCRNNGQWCGTGGTLGFPTNDPEFSQDTVTQKFEGKKFIHIFSNNSISVVAHDKEGRRKLIKIYVNSLADKTDKGELSEIEAFAKMSDYIAIIVDNDTDYMKDLSLMITEAEKINLIYLLKSIIFDANDPYFGKFSDTGFKFEYNDSHYCQNSNAKGVSNQIYHSMGGFNVAFFSIDMTRVELGNMMHELIQKARLTPSPLGTGGSSLEDFNLTTKMGYLGLDLRLGVVNRYGIGDRLLSDFGLPTAQLEGARRSSVQKEDEYNIRIKFRKCENLLFGDPQIFTKWKYDQDMIFENGAWTQYYQKFGDDLNVKVIVDPDTGNIEILNGEYRGVYNVSN